MPERKIGQKNIHKLTKAGGKSIVVTIPIDIVRKLRWREKQKVVIKRVGKRVLIQNWPSKNRQQKLL